MISEWNEYTFEDLKAAQKGAFAMGPFGSNIKAENFVTSGVPVIKGGNLNGTYLVEDFMDFLTDEKAADLSASKARALDLIITHRGTLGQVGIIPENSKYPEYIVSQSQLKLSFDRSRVDPYFIYYFLRSPLGQQRLLANKSQVGVPAIAQALTTVRKLNIRIPALEIQLAICDLLRRIDDRINILRETNVTLETIAQLLFKSWFVDFDPVRAKMEGRPPEGIGEAMAEMFPDAFEESELGNTPSGWGVATVESVCKKVGMGPFGSNIKVETFVNNGVPVISGQHLKKSLVEDLTFNYITEAHAEKLSNSCVVAGDVIFTHAGSIGQVSLLHVSTRFDKYVLSQRQFYLRCDTSKMRPEWMTYFFRSPRGQHLILANASQVGVPSIARPVSYLRSIKLVVPPQPLIDRFADISNTVHNSIIENRERISALVALRDTLLPRLISGHLCLPDVKHQFEPTAA